MFPSPCRRYLRELIAWLQQRIYEIMLKIIRTDIDASQRAQWQVAANEWRLPYWDWAAKQSYISNYGLPEIFTKETIDILPLDSDATTQETIQNPLWKFSNPLGIGMGAPAMGDYALQEEPVCNLRRTYITGAR